MSLTAVTKRFRENARYHGRMAATQLLVVALLRKFMCFERVFLYAFDDMPVGLSMPPEDRTHLATAEEVKRLALDPSFDMADLTPERIDELYASRHRCVFNVVAGAFAGYSWMTLECGRIPKLGIGFELKSGEGYIYKGMTHPRFRGANVANDRFLFWLQEQKKNGRAGLLVDFAFDNKATLTRVKKLNMRRIGAATLIGIGPFKKLFLSGDFRDRKVFPL